MVAVRHFPEDIRIEIVSMNRRPRISAALVLGLVAAPLPDRAAQALLTPLARAIWRRHATAFSGLERESRILIDPLDLPWCALLRPGREPPGLELVAREGDAGWDAKVRAPVSALIALLEGRADGDALFFSRELTIEGDTAAVVALRNAIEGADIRVIEDVLAPLGPLGGAAGRACRALIAAAEAAAARIERLAASFDPPRPESR